MIFREGQLVEFGLFTSGYNPATERYFDIGREEIGFIIVPRVPLSNRGVYEALVLIGECLVYVRCADMKVIA